MVQRVRKSRRGKSPKCKESRKTKDVYKIEQQLFFDCLGGDKRASRSLCDMSNRR
jgi:hypothetical protein